MSSGCNTRSIHLTVVAFALAASAGALAGPEYHFGLSHTPLGGATLSPTAGGGLLVSNIGSSGQDGIAIELGHTTGVAIQLDPGEGGALAPGAMVCVTSTSTGGSLPHASMLEDGGGGAYLVLDSLGMLTPQCVHVELRLGDVVVDSREFPVTAVGQVLVSGPFGSDQFGQPVTFELSSTATDHAIELFNPEAVTASITGSPNGPVTADEVALRLNGLPPGERDIKTLRVVMSNLPDGSAIVAGEYMRIRPKGWDGTIKGHLRTVGAAQMTGIGNPDICAGCPECCDPPGGNPIDLFSGATISNIGSSGNDGVRFACRTWGSPWFVSDIDLRTSGIITDDDDTLSLHAVGTYDGMPGHDLGECALRGDILSGSTELLADFSAVGSSNVLVQVRDNGVPQGSVLLSGGPGVVLGNLYSGSGLPLEWTRCGKLGGVGETPCYVWGSEEHFIFISGPVALVGDDLRVLAIGAEGPLSEIESFTMLGQGLDTFTVTAIRDIAIDVEAEYFGGLAHRRLGGALISIGDVDDADNLFVDNIGSSGQDGVSIDLGQAEGVKVSTNSIRGGFGNDPNDICAMVFDIYDDQCPMCPAGLIASMELTLTGPDQIEFKVQRGLQGNVTLIKLSGEPAGQFTMPLTDTLTITKDAGSSLHVTEMTGAARSVNDVGVFSARCMLEENPPNPADPGVTISHPVHGTFDEVAEIVVIMTDTVPYEGSIDRACVRAMAHPGQTTSLQLTRTGVVQHGHVHHAIGDVALVSQECDDGDSDDDDVIWAAQACCAEDGGGVLDGVEIDLRTASCDDHDDDCDGLSDDTDDEIIAFRWRLYDASEMGASRHALTGTIDDGPMQELCSFERWPPSPGHKTLLTVEPAFGGTPTSRHVAVRDEFDNIVVQADVPQPDPVASVIGGDPDSYTARYGITIVGATETVAFNYQKIEWTYNVSIQLPGQSFESGRSLEVTTYPTSGTPVAMDLDLHSLTVTAEALPGEVMSIGLIEENTELIDPCPADLDGTGNVGFSDLTFLLIHWGPCPNPPPCPGDIDGSGNVGFDDLTQLLISWGPC